MPILGTVKAGLGTILSSIPLWVWICLLVTLFLLIWNGPILAAIGAIGILVLARRFNW